jgi:formylglycine-generating enzyme required for sulfatase activity
MAVKLIRSSRSHRFWLALFLFLGARFTQAQTISNVKATQQGREVLIAYDILGAVSTEKFTVQVFVGTDQGWQGPLKAVKGNAGPNVPGGCCKKITWMALDEYQAFSGNYSFKVVAEPATRKEEEKPRPKSTTAIEPELVFVQGGNFYMGSKKDAPDAGYYEKPRHEVQVSSFYMSKYEVTYGEFKTFVNETGYQTDADKDGGSYIWNVTTKEWETKAGVNWKYDAQGQPRDIDEKRHPVIHVSWNDAQAYMNWLNSKTGKSYRLPTEAEWEFAARGGTKSQGYLYSGSNSINLVAWYNENSGNGTHPVGEKQANELGIFDMTGNVWEWCQDWYDASYYAGRPDLDVNPPGGSPAQFRVNRGGGWYFTPDYCRVAYRSNHSPDGRSGNLGFRLVLPSR